MNQDRVGLMAFDDFMLGSILGLEVWSSPREIRLRKEQKGADIV